MSDERFNRALPAMSLEVVGVRHANSDKTMSNRRFEIMLCKPGDLIALRPEPKNKADPHAIAVFSTSGVQIGYLRAERAPRIRQLLLEGRQITAAFQAEDEQGAWIRVTFDGSLPKLPEHSALPLTRVGAGRLQGLNFYSEETGGDEIYPDEVWPDEVWPDE